MGVARLWMRAVCRRHWRRQVALALAFGLAGAVVIAATAGTRRTASVYERFARAQRLPDLQLQIDASHDDLEALGRLPGVEAAGAYMPFFVAPTGGDLVPGRDFTLFSAADDAYGRTVDRPLISAGRLPALDAPHEVVASESTAAALGLHVGSRVSLGSIPAREAEAFFAGDYEALTFDGPAPTVEVVGIGRTSLDVEAVSYASKYLLAGPAFAATYRDSILVYGELLEVRLTSGGAGVSAFRRAVEARLGASGGLGFSSFADGTSGIRDALRAQAVALALVTLAAAVAAAVAISQIVGRDAAEAAASHATLAALGVGRGERVLVTVASVLPAAAGGALVAVVGAFAASSRFPNGLAAGLEVQRGAQVDGLVFPAGAALVILLVVARAALVGRRQFATVARAVPVTRVGRLDWLGSMFPPAPAAGLRWALPRRDGLRVPARAAVAGAVVGVGGLFAALTYASGLTHLVSTPAEYGWTFDADAGGGDDPGTVAGLRDALLADPAVGDVAVAHIVGGASIGGAEMQVYAFEPVRGTISIGIVNGRPPAGPGEVALGPTSARELGVGIGDTVTAPGVDGGQVQLEVVGLAAFPTIETDRFTFGAALTPDGLARVDAPGGYSEVVFRWAAGISPQDAIPRLLDDRLLSATPKPPGDIANLGRVRNYPRWLAGFLAILALAAVVHGLLVSVHRRRPQTGILRSVGFTRRQVTGAVVVQATTLALVGLAAGVPLGLAAGRWAWMLHVRRIGLAVDLPVPAVALVVTAACAVGVIQLVALAAGRGATRSSPAAALRHE